MWTAQKIWKEVLYSSHALSRMTRLAVIHLTASNYIEFLHFEFLLMHRLFFVKGQSLTQRWLIG